MVATTAHVSGPTLASARSRLPRTMSAAKSSGRAPGWADPATQPAVAGDHRLVTGTRGGRRLAAHDSRQHAWRAGRRVFVKQLDYLVCYSVTPFERSAAQTLSEVTGMSMFVIPYGGSASITALTYAAGEPTVAASPTPFAPTGWCGEGVTAWPISHFGVSHALGRLYPAD